MIEVAQTYREELLQLKKATRQAGIAAYAVSDIYTYGPYSVYCESALKISRGRKIVQRNTWYMNGRRIGENHLLGKIRDLK